LSASLSPLPAGTYSVIVTDNVTGCQDSVSIDVNQAPGSLSSFISTTSPVTCNGGNNGNASVTVQGATGALAYAWSPVGGNAATTSNLPAGTYTVTVTDQSTSCQTTATATITEPSDLALGVLSQTSADCASFGSALANASGGNGPFAYSWNTAPAILDAQATGLANGMHKVYVTDQDGCMDSLDVAIAGSQSPVTVALDATTDASGCALNDGSITVAGTGSNGNITYQWDTNPPAFGPTLNNAYPGFYTVIATGANGCADTLLVTLGPLCPLVVRADQWEVAPMDDHLRLSWNFSANYPLQSFMIERSLDGEDFSLIGEMQVAYPGASYVWPDNEVEANIWYYYRLRAMDVTGQEHLSETRSGRLTGLESSFQHVRLYPNPTHDRSTLEVWSEQAMTLRFRLFNNLGQLLKQDSFDLRAGLSKLNVPTADLADGVYILRILDETGYHRDMKLIKH
ncbi:MAG: T9SS type A sorting domain-containing protein, partial [Bacteroidota bacterium]